MSWTLWVILGSLFGASGVGLGAFAAHGLRDQLSPEHLTVFETAVRYQMYHALALLGVGIVGMRVENLSMQIAGAAFVLGILLFSGSLYLLTLTETRGLGIITPFGGLAFIVGWLALAWGTFNP